MFKASGYRNECEMKNKQRVRNEKVPSIAVLMATYNGGDFIERQIDSLRGQVGVDVHIFVSDDCSTDNTVQVVKQFMDACAQIHLVSENQKFGSAGLNFFHLIKTVDVSGFDYVAFSDQDDIWNPLKLVRAVECLLSKDVSGYSSSIEAYWPKAGRKLYIDKAQPQSHVDHWFESPGPGCTQVFVCSAFSIFQRFVVANDNVISRVDYHDWLVYAFFRHRGLGWYISPESHMLYVQHEANQMGVNSGLTAAFSRLRSLRNGWYRQQVELIHACVSGDAKALVSRDFIFRNATKLRRKKRDSFLVACFLLIGLF